MRMMMSVSTFSRSSGAAIARKTVNLSIRLAPTGRNSTQRTQRLRNGRWACSWEIPGVLCVKPCGVALSLEYPHIGDGAGERRRRRHGRARQMRARARSLPADEIAVRGRDRALAPRHRLAVGGEAHRAAGLAPLESRVAEDAIEPF